MKRVMKEVILNKATEMFLTLGFKSVTMDDIASELAISKKTIYQHYANKNDLVEDSAMALFEKISNGIDRICERGLNSIEEVFTIRDFLMQHLKDENAAPFYQLQKFYPVTFANLRAKQFAVMHGCVMVNLEKGIKDGIFRADLNVDFVSRIYFTGLTGIKDRAIFPADIFNVHEATRQFLEYHMRAIVTFYGLGILEEMLSRNSTLSLTQI
jgi:AcrR family transcriptional regulator